MANGQVHDDKSILLQVDQLIFPTWKNYEG